MSSDKQRGGFVLGLIVGLLIGLGIALGVALYINKTPIPFMNKVPQRTAEQDAEEAEHNKNWDPNAPLSGTKVASGVVSPAPVTPAPTPAPQVATAPAPAPAVAPAAVVKAAVKPASGVDAKPDTKTAATEAKADPFIYFVQAGAYLKSDDAETQRAKLAIQGFTAKVFESEQSGHSVFRVRIGPIDVRDDADAQQKKLEAVGIEANLVRVQR